MHAHSNLSLCDQSNLVGPQPESGLTLENLFTGALAQGQLIWPLLLALIAGFLSSLSPCVYPLIPITLSIMGARRYESHWHGFLVAASYVLGMSVVYTLLGAVGAYLGIIAGSLMQSSMVLIFFAVLFFIMALLTMGAITFKLPSKLLQRVSTIGGKGFKGAFLMGLVAGIIAAPCTGPVLGAILALIARDQNLAVGIALMACFSLGLGLPFLVLGTFSNAISRLPKSGAWMNSVKLFLSSAMFGMSIYFLSHILKPVKIILEYLSTVLATALVTGILFLIISILLYLLKSKIYNIFGIIIGSISFALLLNFNSHQEDQINYTNWYIINDKSLDESQINLILSEARQNCRPVLIDFYADWCIACKQLAHETFSDNKVKDKLSKFYLIKIDATNSTNLLDNLNKRFSVTGLPTIILLDSEGNERPGVRIMGFIKPKALLQILSSY
jgi:thiol:disulfide interchange protein DsbD